MLHKRPSLGTGRTGHVQLAEVLVGKGNHLALLAAGRDLENGRKVLNVELFQDSRLTAAGALGWKIRPCLSG
jgi:hypothetical protein